MDFEIAKKAQDVLEILDKEQTRKNKELVAAGAICLGIGAVVGFFIGKATTSHNTVKKYNKKFTYDFGEEE